MTRAPSWTSLWRQWSALVLASVLALAAVAVWRGSAWAEQQQRIEQRAVLEEIGRGIAASLERARQLGIPLQDMVGLQPWLAAQAQASPEVGALALTWASGAVLQQHADDPALGQALQAQGPDTLGEGWVRARLAVAAADGTAPQAWLHVIGRPAQQPWARVWWSLGLALAVGGGVVLALRGWAWRRIGRPLAGIEAQLRLMAADEPGHAAEAVPAHGRSVIALVEQALARCRADVQQRRAALLQKLNEVRAAHFDPAVLARIDELAEPLLHGGAAQTTAAKAGAPLRTGGRRWSLNRRLALLLLAGWVLVLAGLATLEALHQGRAQAARAQAQTQRLRMAFEQVLAEDLTRLSLLAATWTAAGAADDARPPEPVLPPQAYLWLRQGNEPVRMTAGSASPAAQAPPAGVLDELVLRSDGAQGIWPGADRQWQLGVGRRVPLAGDRLSIGVAAQPLAFSLQRLAGVLGARLSLADHRGQPVGGDEADLIGRWRQAGRQAEPTAEGGWLLSVPVLSYSGHTLGHLVAELAPSGHDSGASGSILLIGGLGLLLAAGGLFLLQQLRPFGHAAAELARLAETGPRGGDSALRLDDLRRDIETMENRLEVYRALRRSRERQGRRQARFIRHQMLELANRLDTSARADVLRDLETMESVGLGAQAPAERPADGATNPHFERMIDEIGVLALGFQNLVGRVGDQYQQLGRLVEELREALRVKTQFIAIQQELEIARKMQLAFLPHDFSGQAGVQVHGVTQPAREVGGDFYDFFRLDAHHLAVLVADVSGKGIPAAFFMAVSRTLMRAVAQFSTGPSDCLRRLNDLLAADNEELMFVTLFYAVIDTRTGAVVYGNAGHNPPYVLRADGAVETIPTLGNMALAVMDGMPYAEQSLVLGPGDALFLFTDGVTEAAAPDGGWYGEGRLEAFLAAHGRPPEVAALSADLLDAIRAFEAGGAQSDDITCLVVRRDPPAAAAAGGAA